jgi:hypothetical protein
MADGLSWKAVGAGFQDPLQSRLFMRQPWLHSSAAQDSASDLALVQRQ